MAFYGNASSAQNMAGGLAISTETQNVVNEIIDTNIREWGFEKENYVEYFDVPDNFDEMLILSRYPVISSESDISITNNVNGESPIAVDENCIRIDKLSGIVRIIPTTQTSNNIITKFTKGVQSVKAEYEYGYSTVPSDIAELANLLAARWAKIGDQQSNADGLKSLKIADYTESFDIKFNGISVEFDENTKLLFNSCIRKYRVQ